MSTAALQPGQRVTHRDFGDGVVVQTARDGYVRVFFSTGERQVPTGSLLPALGRAERVLRGLAQLKVCDEERLRKAWLAYEAYALPLMENASALTAAKIDLLPHQVVLTHQIATASPRRYLIADEVGLGKTIETALILRELASRGELSRALMVVPAGLVNNWHRELNEVFNLNFEVFGSEGDVTDRKSNAFAKHDRLIASIDTLKRPARIKRLKDAPPWDLVVFDEAHHLTAFRVSNKVRKTENFKLAEALKAHSRDLLLLSATPHQGDHFRFWMLIQLLNPTLFNSTQEMIRERHRLNAVVFRRTKADACRPDGSPLFLRRWVHTESFVMSEAERRFYAELHGYLEDGFALAKRRGRRGQALGFVMSIFQKIAASSFAAIRKTLRRRLLALTVHEALLRDQDLDLDAREALYDEARQMIREEYGLQDNGPLGRSEVDRLLAEMKARMARSLNEEELALAADSFAGEFAVAQGEEVAATAVTMALPEERLRIHSLLAMFPEHEETKVEKLISALGTLWRQNPEEKVVVFATYLGTVDLISKAVNLAYPGQGVVVLRGGDHGSKLAAERRFKQKDGPRVLVCTAAGREGINLQFARILFNFDLPWNPMDLEQRIGRIHRYGQRHTAQVYNLVLSDTIEGKIFLMLNDKLIEIARALGKIDKEGNIAEDLRSQILGQLAERLSYDQLYKEALSDPELRRTRIELETALANATEARKVVFELFQDLDGFRLEDYKPFEDITGGMNRILKFLKAYLRESGRELVPISEIEYEIRDGNSKCIAHLTTSREVAREQPDIDLLGVDHPIVQQALQHCRTVPPEAIGVSVAANGSEQAVLTFWHVQTQGENAEALSLLLPLASSLEGRRLPSAERKGEQFFFAPATNLVVESDMREHLLRTHLEPMLKRELRHREAIPERGSFSAELIGWIELAPK